MVWYVTIVIEFTHCRYGCIIWIIGDATIKKIIQRHRVTSKQKINSLKIFNHNRKRHGLYNFRLKPSGEFLVDCRYLQLLLRISLMNLWSYDSIFIFYSQFALYFLIIWLKGNTRWLADKLNVNVLLKPAKNVVSALKIIDIMKLICFYWNCACFNLWIHLALNAITWYKPICHWILTY